MTITQLLFSFEGRIRRSQWWLGRIGLWLVSSVICGVMFSVAGPHWYYGGTMPGFVFPGLGLVGLVCIWIGFALDVKRWHDRDKSGWFVLILLIPIVGFFWWLIELGCLDSKPDNRFGPSPKASGMPAAA